MLIVSILCGGKGWWTCSFWIEGRFACLADSLRDSSACRWMRGGGGGGLKDRRERGGGEEENTKKEKEKNNEGKRGREESRCNKCCKIQTWRKLLAVERG